MFTWAGNIMLSNEKNTNESLKYPLNEDISLQLPQLKTLGIFENLQPQTEFQQLEMQTCNLVREKMEGEEARMRLELTNVSLRGGRGQQAQTSSTIDAHAARLMLQSLDAYQTQPNLTLIHSSQGELILFTINFTPV